MAKKSKFYQISNQILLEYIQNHYAANETPDVEQSVNYVVYTGLDNNVYYSDFPKEEDNIIDYKNSQYFIKFSDETQSEYKFLGFYKNEQGEFSNQNFINEIFEGSENISKPKLVKAYHRYNTDQEETGMCYDTIKLHFIYGFILNELAGITLQVKTKARYLGPIQDIDGYNHLATDDYGNPIFKTIKTIDGKVLEPLTYKETDLILLDYFLPKECLNFNNLLHYHKNPIYQNGSYYDRYIEIKVPSAYYLSLNSNIPLSVKNPYGIIQNTREYISSTDEYIKYKIGNNIYKLNKFTDQNFINLYNKGLYNYLPQYNEPGLHQNRILTYNVLPDPKLEIKFSTVQDINLKTIYDITNNTIDNIVQTNNYGLTSRSNVIRYRSIFLQDFINTISLTYISNSDYFNAVILEDSENKEILYYPTFGNGDNAPKLDMDIMNKIESGEIPLTSEAFYDGLENIQTFYETYGDDAYKWVILNELSVTFNYAKMVNSTTISNTIAYSTLQHFTQILDYGQYKNTDPRDKFYIGHYVPRPSINYTDENVTSTSVVKCHSIQISYTCRLINRLNNIEIIRNSTLNINDPKIYEAKTVQLKNVVTYKIFNKISPNIINKQNVIKEQHDKFIRSYYDATNLVVKDMGTNAIYTQGQMTLYLKRSSTNYMFRLFTLNQDNVRVPFDLTGPYRYLLTFPAIDGSKIKIMPNKDSVDVQLGIGQLVFYITEQQVRRIMAVPAEERYFAITTDTDTNDSQISTLYEGKVAYYS